MAEARHVSELLQQTAGNAAQRSSACLQQASDAGSTFVRMADKLMKTAQGLPAGTDSLSTFCTDGCKSLDDALAVLQETCKIVKARPP